MSDLPRLGHTPRGLETRPRRTGFISGRVRTDARLSQAESPRHPLQGQPRHACEPGASHLHWHTTNLIAGQTLILHLGRLALWGGLHRSCGARAARNNSAPGATPVWFPWAGARHLGTGGAAAQRRGHGPISRSRGGRGPEPPRLRLAGPGDRTDYSRAMILRSTGGSDACPIVKGRDRKRRGHTPRPRNGARVFFGSKIGGHSAPPRTRLFGHSSSLPRKAGPDCWADLVIARTRRLGPAIW